MSSRRLPSEGSPAPAAVVLAIALAGLGCAKARNYADPHAPVFSGGSAASPVSATTLRVVSFNLKWGEHVDRAQTLLEARGPLRDADLVVLQEMDRPGSERLARALGYSWVYVPSAVHPVPHRDFGVALLSRWPLEAPRKLLLPHQDRFSKLRRSAVVATLRSPLGAVRVYGVHLEAPSGAWGVVRRDQARTVLLDAEGWSGPVLVAGDFNGRGAPSELAQAGYYWPTRPLKHTVGLFAFDHVLARGLCGGASPVAGVAPDPTHASDHRPVWAVLAPCGPA